MIIANIIVEEKYYKSRDIVGQTQVGAFIHKYYKI